MTDRTPPAVLKGKLIRRGDAEYERAREEAVWNGLVPDRFPEAVVQAADEDDVRAGLAYARTAGLRVCVRSGGHNWSGVQLRDGALLLDLSRLNRCVLDPWRGTATVGPAVTNRLLATALERHGLAFPYGHCPTVAMGGYLLSGGLGWNSRAWGPGCRHVEEIEAVTADGRTLVCNETQNADLFWAARGAGPGFFAVVTRFRLRLRPQPAAVATTSFTFPLSLLERLSEWAVPTALSLPPEVETTFALTADGPAAGAEGPGPRVILSATAFGGTRRQAVEALAPLDRCPLAGHALTRSLSRPTPRLSLFTEDDEALPKQHRFTVDTLWSSEPYKAQLARASRAIAAAPSRKSLFLVPVEPVAPDHSRDMAFSPLGESFLIGYAVWDDPAADEANKSWLRQAMTTLDPDGTGGRYIGEADLEAGQSRSSGAYAPAAWERLRRLKSHWDPDNLFHSYPTP